MLTNKGNPVCQDLHLFHLIGHETSRQTLKCVCVCVCMCACDLREARLLSIHAALGPSDAPTLSVSFSCPITVSFLAFLLYCLCSLPPLTPLKQSRVGFPPSRQEQRLSSVELWIFFFLLWGMWCYVLKCLQWEDRGDRTEIRNKMVITDPLEE